MGYVDRRRAKYTAKWDVQMAGMNFQTRSIPYREKKERRFLCPHVCGRGEKRLATERSAKNFAPVIAATPDFTNVRLPRCGYLVLDKNCQMIDSEIPTF